MSSRRNRVTIENDPDVTRVQDALRIMGAESMDSRRDYRSKDKKRWLTGRSRARRQGREAKYWQTSE